MFVAREVSNEGTESRLVVVRESAIFINVCGIRYETTRETLEKHPNTLLGDEKKR